MLVTWKRTVYDKNDRERQRLNGVVVPDCCEAAKMHLAVRLRYSWDDLTETRFADAIPKWVVDTPFELSRDVHGHDRPEPVSPKFCPYCGTVLPAIRRRAKPPKNVHKPVLDGDYCGTCHERSRGCRCMYPEVLWETVPPSP